MNPTNIANPERVEKESLRNFLYKLIDVVYSRRENSVTGDYWIILSYLEIIISNQRERERVNEQEVIARVDVGSGRGNRSSAKNISNT